MSEEKVALSAEQLESLRYNKSLNHDEVAWITGDLVIAENVITKTRRVLFEASRLKENRRILKG